MGGGWEGEVETLLSSVSGPLGGQRKVVEAEGEDLKK